MWCVRYERPPSSIYSTRMDDLGVDKLGDRLAPSLHAAMQLLEKREAERAWGWFGRTRTLGRPVRLLLCLVGSLVDLEHSLGGAWSICVGWMGLLCFPWCGCHVYAFRVAPFDYNSTIFAFVSVK